MTYVRLEDSFPAHPKIIGLPDPAFRLWIEGLCYAHALTTDGWVPRLAMTPRLRRHALTLIKAGLWIPHPDEDGWLIKDYLGWYLSRADIEDQHRRAVEAGKRGARKRWGTP